MDEITKNIYEALSNVLDLPKNITSLKLELNMHELPKLTMVTIVGSGELRDDFVETNYEIVENKQYKLKKLSNAKS